MTSRVAIVATSYPSHEGDPSGHFVRAEAVQLAARGFEVHVVAPRPHRGDEGVTAHEAGGAALFAWPGAVARARASWARLGAAPVFAGRAAALLRRIDPDETIAHWLVPCAVPIAIAHRRSALVARCHGADVRLLASMPRAAVSLCLRPLVERSAHITTASTRLRDTLVTLGEGPTRAWLERAVTVAPPQVDVSVDDDARARARALLLSLGVSGRHAIVSGRLVPEKAVDVAIEAASRVPELTLLVLGDGPDRARLAALAGAGKVRFAGLVGRSEALALVEQSCILVHMSRVDEAPTAVTEARRLGVPVVARPVGDVPAWAASDAGIELATDVDGVVAALRRSASRR